MGCDIHPSVERRVAGKWERVEVPGQREDLGFDTGWDAYKGTIDYHLTARRYSLFTMLADVRGYDDLQPIALPRGLPKDCAGPPPSEFYEAGDLDWFGDHSFSWLTLAELDGYDWASECRGSTKADLVGEFYTVVLPWLRTLGAPEDVRLVFGFDN